MSYLLTGTYTYDDKTYDSAVIKASNIRTGEVDGLYSFDVDIYSDSGLSEKVETCDYLGFEIPTDISDEELELRAINIAAAVFMPSGVVTNDDD